MNEARNLQHDKRTRRTHASVCCVLLIAVVLAGCAVDGDDGQELGDRDSVVSALAANEIALLEGDPEQLAQRSIEMEAAKLDRFAGCLADDGLSDQLVDFLVDEAASTIEVIEGDPLSRGYVEEFGFGIAVEPPMRRVDNGHIDRSESRNGSNRVDNAEPAFPSASRSPELAMSIADCEEHAESFQMEQSSATEAMAAISHSRTVVEERARAHPESQALSAHWSSCMSDEGYRGATGGELRDVGELIASLGLEGAAGLAAPRIERQAAVASYDCAGGREGLEDMMVLRIEIAREVAEEMDPEDARLIGEFWANE